MTIKPDLEAALGRLLADYDAAVADCPVRANKPGNDDHCKACGANSSQNCGKDGSASYALVNGLRPLVLEGFGSRQPDPSPEVRALREALEGLLGAISVHERSGRRRTYGIRTSAPLAIKAARAALAPEGGEG